MHRFCDNAGRTWVVSINVTAIKRVRGLVGIDLYKLIDDGFRPLGTLVADPVQLADVLYCLCKDEADAKQISDEDFGRALAGDAITLAADAFVEELIDFFPDARTRANPSSPGSVRIARWSEQRRWSRRLCSARVRPWSQSGSRSVRPGPLSAG